MRNNTPGPGSYNAALSARDYGGAASAFKSESQRLQVEDADVGDPGAYDPYASGDIATTSRRSYNRSAKGGRNGFGAQSARAMKVDIFGENTPGPGQYDSKRPQEDTRNSMPSSSFKSSASQRRPSAWHT